MVRSIRMELVTIIQHAILHDEVWLESSESRGTKTSIVNEQKENPRVLKRFVRKDLCLYVNRYVGKRYSYQPCVEFLAFFGVITGR